MIVGTDRIGIVTGQGTKADVLGSDLAAVSGLGGIPGQGILTSAATGITAFATGGQASATQLTAAYNNISTCATAADSVKLLPAVLGVRQVVRNSGAANLAVFPYTGGTINGGSANASVTIPPGGQLQFDAVSDTDWRSPSVAVALGGVAPAAGLAASPRLCHTGGRPAAASTEGTNLSAVVTELYVAEVFIPCNMTITGAAVFWGDATEGNAKVCLFDSTGARVAISASTDISGYTADSYGTNIAFSAAYAAKGPATYYVGVICDSSSNSINTHVLGAFGAGKITGLVYGTEAGYATITPPTTFTTGLGPIASLY